MGGAKKGEEKVATKEKGGGGKQIYIIKHAT